MRTGSVKPMERVLALLGGNCFSVLDADRFGETNVHASRGRVAEMRFSVLDADRFGETAIWWESTNIRLMFQCPRCGPVR